MSGTRRMTLSGALFTVAVILGGIAARSVFSRDLGLHFQSARTNELIVDALGIAASMLAFLAAPFAYPMRASLWVRVYLTFVLLFAIAYAFEFFLGFMWFAVDGFRPFGQHT